MRAALRFLAVLSLVGSACVSPAEDDSLSSTSSELTTGPDYQETGVSDPPANLRLGDTFSVADTAVNNGTLAGAPSQTNFYLSPNSAAPFTLSLRFSAKRSVAGLGTGASDSGTTSLVTPSGIPDGVYYVVACADGNNAVPETNESNNCTASTNPTNLTAPDLAISVISEPPASATLRVPFTVSDTTTNLGTAAAVPSQTAYYLSTTNAAPWKFALRFPATRSVPALISQNSTNSGPTTVTVPAGMPDGAYYLVACADYSGVAFESNETNNCKSSVGTVTLHSPDLTVPSASEPPSSVLLGQSFSITDTVGNPGGGDAAPSSNVYYLSTTNTAPYQIALRFPMTRSVAAIPAGNSNTGSVSLIAQANINEGTYYLITCADQAGVVAESNETNNCHSSTTQVSLHAPDLTISAASMNVTQVDANGTVTFTDTVTNLNTTASPTIEVGHVLSTDAVHDANDDAIGPCTVGGAAQTRTVGPVTAGAPNTGSVTVGGPICVNPASPHVVAPGTYYVFACADVGGVAYESNEGNNCLLLSQTLTIGSCGNGVLEPGEQCDDHNNTNGDGCSATCQTQTLSSVEVLPANTSVPSGLTQQYQAIAHYSDGYAPDVTTSATWSTGAITTATITSPAALLTAHNLGTTNVNAVFGGKTGTTNVTVTAAIAVDLAITPQLVSLPAGVQQQFTATEVFSDGSTVDVTSSATWASSAPTVASITNPGGLATALVAGDTTISASFGGFSDSTNLNVNTATINTVAVTPVGAFVPVNTTLQYTATGTFSDTTQFDLTTVVVWSASPGNRASFTATPGQMLAGGVPATVTVRAVFQGVAGSTTANIVAAGPTSITISPATATIPKGFQQQYTALAVYAGNPTPQDVTTSVTWTSSSTNIATINGKGLATVKNFTGLSGSTNIRATLGGTASNIAVLNATSATLTSITIAPNPASVGKRLIVQLSATGKFSDNSTLDITTQCNWSSSDKPTASVSQTGAVKGKKVGSVTITAKKGNVSGIGTVNVTP